MWVWSDCFCVSLRGADCEKELLDIIRLLQGQLRTHFLLCLIPTSFGSPSIIICATPNVCSGVPSFLPLPRAARGASPSHLGAWTWKKCAGAPLCYRAGHEHHPNPSPPRHARPQPLPVPPLLRRTSMAAGGHNNPQHLQARCPHTLYMLHPRTLSSLEEITSTKIYYGREGSATRGRRWAKGTRAVARWGGEAGQAVMP